MLHPKLLPEGIITSYYRHFEGVSGLAVFYYKDKRPIYYLIKLIIDDERLIQSYDDNRSYIIISGLLKFYTTCSKVAEFAIKLNDYEFGSHRGSILFEDAIGEYYLNSNEFGINSKGFVL
jgi:hypothetical protein